MANKIYIGYCQKDKELICNVKAAIESLTKSSVLMLRKDVEGVPEQYVLDAINAIVECDYFLFILTENSQLSETALLELSFAKKKTTNGMDKIFIVRFDNCILNDSFMFRWGNEKIYDWNNNSDKMQLINLLVGDSDKSISGLNKLHIIERDGKKGFVDHKGDIVIPCKWTKVDDFHEGLAAVDDSSGKYGYLDINGNRVIPCTWDKAESFEDGLAVVKVKNGLWDYKCGVIDKDVNMYLPFEYDSLEYIGCGMFKYYNSPKYGIVNEKNERIYSPVWKSIGRFSDGLCPVENDKHQWGYIDKNKLLVIPFWWNDADDFSAGLAIVRDKDRKSGVIDIQGKVVIPCYYDYLCGFHEGLCAFEKEGKIGFINKEDEIVIKAEWLSKYSFSCRFNSGRFLVKNEEGKYGYINKLGSLVIPYTWSNAENFENGTAWVYVDNTWKLIDTDGNYVK